MISAVDSSVLLDVLLNDPTHGKQSADLLEEAFNTGGLIVSEIVYAEIASQFDSQQALDFALAQLNIRMVCSNCETAFMAGQRWWEYRRAGGTRTRLLADFLIGAHALVNAERLLTRDRGFFRTYFPELTLAEGHPYPA
jgi:predicted nucleic acid-binding protein